MMLVAAAGVAMSGCNRQEPVPAAGDPSIEGVSPGHMMAVNPSILEDQHLFYSKHEAQAPASAPASEPATAPADGAATTAPATPS
jgi:hypothetical protein